MTSKGGDIKAKPQENRKQGCDDKATTAENCAKAACVDWSTPHFDERLEAGSCFARPELFMRVARILLVVLAALAAAGGWRSSVGAPGGAAGAQATVCVPAHSSNPLAPPSDDQCCLAFCAATDAPALLQTASLDLDRTSVLTAPTGVELLAMIGGAGRKSHRARASPFGV